MRYSYEMNCTILFASITVAVEIRLDCGGGGWGGVFTALPTRLALCAHLSITLTRSFPPIRLPLPPETFPFLFSPHLHSLASRSLHLPGASLKFFSLSLLRLLYFHGPPLPL